MRNKRQICCRTVVRPKWNKQCTDSKHVLMTKYDDFDFIGPTPIDFDTLVNGVCVWPELCNFDLIKQIFNLIKIFIKHKMHIGSFEYLTLNLNVKIIIPKL